MIYSARTEFCWELPLRPREQAIDQMVELQAKSGSLKDKEVYKQAILAREQMSSTAIEAGIAVPHAKSDTVTAPSPVRDDA